ncbi:MAG: hydantoinase/oxoprolinase family protein, partial [Betaproteobacteria bacterium]|nr:hydantoinase/oxoprolinase family protein [Betaproteobacteria bacterium]
HEKHEQLHLFAMLQQDVEFLTFHLRLSSPQTRVKLPATGPGRDDPAAALKLRRPCWFKGKWVDTPVYEGKKLCAGNRIAGPAIIEEPNTTVVIPEGFRCTANERGYYVLTGHGSY